MKILLPTIFLILLFKADSLFRPERGTLGRGQPMKPHFIGVLFDKIKDFWSPPTNVTSTESSSKTEINNDKELHLEWQNEVTNSSGMLDQVKQYWYILETMESSVIEKSCSLLNESLGYQCCFSICKLFIKQTCIEFRYNLMEGRVDVNMTYNGHGLFKQNMTVDEVCSDIPGIPMKLFLCLDTLFLEFKVQPVSVSFKSCLKLKVCSFLKFDIHCFDSNEADNYSHGTTIANVSLEQGTLDVDIMDPIQKLVEIIKNEETTLSTPEIH